MEILEALHCVLISGAIKQFFTQVDRFNKPTGAVQAKVAYRRNIW